MGSKLRRHGVVAFFIVSFSIVFDNTSILLLENLPGKLFVPNTILFSITPFLLAC